MGSRSDSGAYATASVSIGRGNGPHPSSSISAVVNNSGPGIGSRLGSAPGVYATTTISGGTSVSGRQVNAPSVVASAAALQNWGAQPDVLGHLLTPNIPGVTPANVIATHELADRKVAQHVPEWAETQKSIDNFTATAGPFLGCVFGSIAGAKAALPAGPYASIVAGGMGCIAGGVAGAITDGIAKDLKSKEKNEK